jgi:16S rRNA (uracil1498-N3)-methyltransferase
MPDFRVHCLPPNAEPASLALSAAESHHLVAVNRARPGDPVIAFDGHGREWICTLVDADKRRARLEVRSARTARPLACQITLGQALPKGAAMDDIVRQATELGAARIAPLESERTQVHLGEDRTERKVEKWRGAALEAAKQCGNPWLPEILPLQSVADFVASAGQPDLKLIASLQPGAKSLKQALSAYAAAAGRRPRTAVWLVGPEGDFSPAELLHVQKLGFEPITLGPLVLRCDTAAVYALSILSYELQGMD